jgi:hypothetical protein
VTDAQQSRFRRCPGCGAQLAVSDRRCWLCLCSLRPLAENLDGSRSPGIVPGNAGSQFSLATILLLTTLIAVCLAACRVNPCLGTWTVLLFVPAMIRTICMGAAEAGRGHRLSICEKLAAFLWSLGVVVLMYAAGFVAFATSCTFLGAMAAAAGPAAELILIVGLIVGTGLGAAAAIWVLWALRPRWQ